jgi:hypothetical protein
LLLKRTIVLISALHGHHCERRCARAGLLLQRRSHWSSNQYHQIAVWDRPMCEQVCNDINICAHVFGFKPGDAFFPFVLPAELVLSLLLLLLLLL